ncbi:xylulokinase [Pararhizobium antarcticum]|uniref:Xylulose kinase n=1 Tax=Pararhizobium antarcticum TaxID=1798805 RepID=A0A657LQN2_9HYPH|nr:FGGY-family carbohydrate kinase [Pararhizobium antarcticum]OJF91386.1 xylulose kinase [Rhizobium sp. 58]OJF93801.1 xylulose kinase [Pararhizobium antarcticum]
MNQTERYIIGVDSSTQSVKAIAWTRSGEPRCEGRAPHTLITPDAYRAEQDPEEWWSAAKTALRKVTATIDPVAIDGIAISNQRETMALLGVDRRPLAPATVWLDRRARDMTAVMIDEIGRDRLHSISGKPVDVIPCIYRLRWLRAHEPDLLDRVAHILSVHDYLVMQLTGEPAATWTSADPFGIFDIQTKTWSRDLLDHLGIDPSRLPPVHRPGAQIGVVTSQAAAETGLLAGTPVFAAGGDGHCAGLGVGAIDPGTVYLNLGTAVAGGLWSPTPELSTYWRTLVSPTGEGYMLETVQRAGAFFVNWLLDNFAGGRADPSIFQRLEAEAMALPVGSEGVTACTYLLGCMDPHWDENARASFTGLGPKHSMRHLYRASLEAITLEFARALAEMTRRTAGAREIFVIGGGASSLLWRKMVADATGFPVHRSLSDEASALGAGISAAVGAGWFPDFKTAVQAMCRTAEAIDPDPRMHDAWGELSVRQAGVFAGQNR